MSTPLKAIYSGTFSTDAAASPVTLNLPSGATSIEIVNLTDWGSTAANTNVIKARGLASLTAGSGETFPKTNGAATIGIPTMQTSGCFTFFSDSASQNLTAATAITGVSQANPAVVSTGDTTTVPLVAGDVVRIYGITGMQQVSSLDFSVGTVVANTSFQLKYLNSSGFVAPGTAGFWRKIPFASGPSVNVGGIAPNPRFYPRARYITAITAANPAVITLSVAHSFTVGEKVRIIVPNNFGMTQLNNYLATITAVSYANNTITIDADSSAMTAFAFPTSAVAALGTTFAQVIPVGEAAINTPALPVGNFLFDATKNASINGVIIGSTALVASKSYSFTALYGTAV